MNDRASAVLGWDVGGAHLKACLVDRAGRPLAAMQVPCALWRGLDHLDRAQAAIAEALSDVLLHAVTMSGEMADLFPDRATGVAAISERMTRLCAPGRVRFYAGTRTFADAAQAVAQPAAIASANWLATAHCVASKLPAALLVDVGSTTTDVSALLDGRCLHAGSDDRTRLASGELTYVGVVRTPVMALADRAPVRGTWVTPMAELFATSADVFRLTGDLFEPADQHDSADGSGKTLADSARRLARMVGEDADPRDPSAQIDLARWFAECVERRVHDASLQILSRTPLPTAAPVVGAGCGRFLARRVARRLGRPWIDFAQVVDNRSADPDWLAICAPAAAVAWMLASCT